MRQFWVVGGEYESTAFKNLAEGTTEDPERIIESVKNQTESDDKDLSPDGLVYNVSNLELEVER